MKKKSDITYHADYNNITAVSTKTKDALYLKNGSVIYGKLLEISENRYKIQTSDGSLFNYSSDEVDKFLKESPVLKEEKQVAPVLPLKLDC